MVGADEEMSVVRWKIGEEPEGKPEGKPEGEPQGKEGMDADVKRGLKKESPDILALMLDRVIDTILLEEVAELGMKMNRYKGVLAEGILTFAEGHQEDKADITHLIEAFRQGWKVYRVNEQKKTALDTFMAAMNNQLWVPESTPDEHA